MTVGSAQMQQLGRRLSGKGARVGGTLPIPPGNTTQEADQLLQRGLLTEMFKLQQQNELLFNAIRREVGTEDLLMQMEADYFTTGSDTSFTLTLTPQSRQQMRIKGFSLGCKPGTNGANSGISTLITTGTYGYVQIHNFVVNFNVPSVTETRLDILVSSQNAFQFYMAMNSGDFPADLHFFGFMWGQMVPSSEGVLG